MQSKLRLIALMCYKNRIGYLGLSVFPYSTFYRCQNMLVVITVDLVSFFRITEMSVIKSIPLVYFLSTEILLADTSLSTKPTQLATTILSTAQWRGAFQIRVIDATVASIFSLSKHITNILHIQSVQWTFYLVRSIRVKPVHLPNFPSPPVHLPPIFPPPSPIDTPCPSYRYSVSYLGILRVRVMF